MSATYANGEAIPAKFLSTIDQAKGLLADLIKAGIHPLSIVREWTFQNDDDKHGLPITITEGDPHRYYSIQEPGGWQFNVGEMLASEIGLGSWDAKNLGSMYNPVWVPATPLSPAPAPVAQPLAPAPPGYQYQSIAGFNMLVPIQQSAPVASGGGATLTPEQASILTRLGRWLSMMGQ